MIKLTIEAMKDLAISKGGQCLSEIYTGTHEKLKWKCNVCNNVWEATANNVKIGTWCPRCTHKEKLTLLQMKDLAISRDGECLSSAYINADTNLLWKCNVCGEKWEAVPYNIKLGTWCPKCSGLKKKTIEEMRELAITKGGKCLSDKYTNCFSNLLWECEDCNRTWEATPANVIRGTWCPYCSHIGEESCRSIFEEIFKVEFPKKRPSWLVNEKTGRRMELDGFNQELKIAFEYNGLQHYTVVNPFHSSEDDLKSSIERDVLKANICKEQGITLIIVPQLRMKLDGFPYLTVKTLKSFILNELKVLDKV